jgi:Topoisomerase DNA binding C4 zinc finger/HNH endonuclease
MNYQSQLSHLEWKALRRQKISSVRAKCELCGKGGKLHVHHIQYFDGRMAWQYEFHELEVLCATCHAQKHGANACQFKGCGSLIEAPQAYCYKHKLQIETEVLEQQTTNLYTQLAETENQLNSKRQELESTMKRLQKEEAEFEHVNRNRFKIQSELEERALNATRTERNQLQADISRLEAERRTEQLNLVLFTKNKEGRLRELKEIAIEKTREQRQAIIREAERRKHKLLHEAGEQRLVLLRDAEDRKHKLTWKTGIVVCGITLFFAIALVLMHQASKLGTSSKSESIAQTIDRTEQQRNQAKSPAVPEQREPVAKSEPPVRPEHEPAQSVPGSIDSIDGHLECPRRECEGVMHLHESGGRKYYACSNSPRCKMTVQYPFVCYKCQAEMVLRTNQSTGAKFWGCSTFPECRHTNDYVE